MDNPLIKKKILSSGRQLLPITNGTRVQFHYKTQYYDDDNEVHVVDDSRETKSPMVLIIGKKFKFEPWEVAVQTMALNEVASFTVDRSLTSAYPFISKTLRDVKKPACEKRSHVCGATLHTEGVGYDDLNQLITNPRDLEFILELIEVTAAENYEKETWQMSEDEKMDQVPLLKEEGNRLYKNKEYVAAAEKYKIAIGILEQLMLKEKPRDVEWNELNALKIPILLNFSQCQLLAKEYYSVIEHCSTILDSDAENVKALYRRGKAHFAVWNMDEAEADFKKVAELDSSLANLIVKELLAIKEEKRKQYELDKLKYHKKDDA